MNYRHGKSKTPIYRIWNAMIMRCHNPNQAAYENYGGRGIFVCDRWRASFLNFLEDVGERPSGMSLERLDNSRGYEPENVVWADMDQQNSNKRSTRTVLFKGQMTPLFIVARNSGVPYATLRARLKLGYSADEATNPDFDKNSKSREAVKAKALLRTHCINGHELTPDNTFIYSAKRPVRCCKKCRSENRLRRLGRPLVGTERP